MKCLLCGSGNLKVLESISRKDLLKLWLDNDVNVYDEIQTNPVNKYHCIQCGLRFFDPSNAGGNKFYSTLGEHDWYYLHEGKSEYDLVQEFIREGDKVLDVGSGRGVLYTRIQKKIDYTGLELSSKAVELARAAGINVINQNLEQHVEANRKSYNVACLFQVMEHLVELDQFMHILLECIKPGGYICVAVPNNGGFLSVAVNNAFNLPPHHTIHWTKESLSSLGSKHNLKIVVMKEEELQAVHKDWYVTVVLIHKIKKFIGRGYRSIDQGIVHSLIVIFVSRIRKIKWLDKLFKTSILNRKPAGHSLFVVYQK